MNMKYLPIWPLMALYLAFLPITTSAQARESIETLSGRVVIKANGKPARGTQIWIHEAKGHGDYTVQQDSTGAFSLSLPEGYYVVLVGNLGLIPYAKEIWLRHGHPINLMVSLEPDFDIMQDTP